MFMAPGVRRPLSLISAALASASALVLAGCGMGTPATGGSSSAAVHGVVHGGQSPIQEATVTLYHTAQGGSAYGTPGVVIGTATTDENGNFTINTPATSSNCPADGTDDAMVYITAAGGYPAGSPTLVNSNMLEVAALGDCANISASTQVILNEITTIAAAYALSSFTTTSYDSANNVYVANIGAPAAVTYLNGGPGNPSGLYHAFINASHLADFTTGQAVPSVTVTSGGSPVVGTVPVVEINTLADAMQACVDTQSSNDTTSAECTRLFNDTPSISGVTPQNTLQAFVNLARNPYPSTQAFDSSNGILALAKPTAAFQPILTGEPNDYAMVIPWVGASTTKPSWMALDAQDTVYLSSAASGTAAPYGISAYGNTPPAFDALTAGTTSSTRGLAADVHGNLWIVNNSSGANAKLFQYSASTGALTGTYTTNSYPYDVAIDGNSNIWVGHAISSGTNTVYEFAYDSGSGTWASTPTNTGTTPCEPYTIAVDRNANVWVPCYAGSTPTDAVMFPNTGTDAQHPAYAGTGGVLSAPITTTFSGGATKAYYVVFDVNNTAYYSITGSSSSPTLSISGFVPVTADAALNATTLTSGTFVPGSTAGSTAQNNTLGTLSPQLPGIDGAGTLFFPGNHSAADDGIHIYLTQTKDPAYPSQVLSPTNGITGCAVTGTTCSTGSSGAIYNPRQVVIDSTGSAWAPITSGGASQVIGIAAPTYPLLQTGLTGGLAGKNLTEETLP